MMGHDHLIRREFLGAALAGTAGILGLSSARAVLDLTGLSTRPAAAAEPPPETATIRLPTARPTVCIAPQYLAEEFLPGEGFGDVQYVNRTGPDTLRALSAGEVDLAMFFSGPFVTWIDMGHPLLVLAGVHIGCFELFATSGVRRISDLKGKTIAVRSLGDADHVFLSSMLAFVGVDPRASVKWVVHPPAEADQLLAEGKIDALMAFAPRGEDLRARKIGHVIVDSAVDRPWGQYFCCMVAANREFARRHPVATRRALRAILKAAELVVREPERAARFLVDRGYTKRYDYALAALKHLPYGHWRDVDPEDTLRFYANRLHEAGMVKSSPQKLIAQGTDWRFLNELKRASKRSEQTPKRAPDHHPWHHRG